MWKIQWAVAVIKEIIKEIIKENSSTILNLLESLRVAFKIQRRFRPLYICSSRIEQIPLYSFLH